MTSAEPGGRWTPPARLTVARKRALDLVERHGDDYLEEGKRLLRRVRHTVVVVGLVATVTLLVIAGLVAYAILR